MAEAKNTHVAVHAIQYRDEKGGAYEIAPGAEFAPRDIKALDTAELEKRGAIRKIKAEKPAADAADKGGEKK